MSHEFNNNALANALARSNYPDFLAPMRILNSNMMKSSQSEFLYTQCYYTPSKNELLIYLKTTPKDVTTFTLNETDTYISFICYIITGLPSIQNTFTHVSQQIMAKINLPEMSYNDE